MLRDKSVHGAFCTDDRALKLPLLTETIVILLDKFLSYFRDALVGLMCLVMMVTGFS